MRKIFFIKILQNAKNAHFLKNCVSEMKGGEAGANASEHGSENVPCNHHAPNVCRL